MAAATTSKSTLSTESPPFNPNNLLRGGSNHGRNSPFRTSNRPPANDHPNSNATPKYRFDDPATGETMEIRNVWAENAEEEMRYIREVIEKYPYVAMDTEFPGVVAKPVTESFTADYHYKSLKVNVDLLRVIQLGLTFADKEGNLCKEIWQFNFQFDLDEDMFAQDSIDLLVHSGISFQDHATRGIDPQLFGELLMVSGLVLDDRVKWVSFHSAYDFAYLLKILTTQELPSDEKSFFELLKIYFPTIYDIKYMCSLLDGHYFVGGLQRLADDLKCQRLGAEHQAGSDSLLTMSAYFALVKAKFTSAAGVDDRRYANELFGYGNNHTVRKGPRAAAAALDHSVSTGSLPGMD
mmetsp:Transcript_16397/g.47474  ORF Transcript_16397/g.47474 Transcript_16397/m.47474 type:complete len:351 (-) Transcript_16397:36-1088(-)|eukprot:CAMPEP_0176067032 /NCGR_PEP_ID=MMETSP0120_2-20121206/33455_1 /TAXON_ID=160619 /ORGANISM="Kryptoperidinium foliaceum, Strain CCMP 1326" /LENGTH=350 /DNA_ID=CAMNT_0017400643 /DNA_START=113 /DNA_END=1165 /DNA_ORIENTATION=-